MKLFIRLLPGTLWFFLILYLLTIPGQQLPKANWMDTLQIDKLIHAGLFCTLALLVLWGILSTKPGMNIRRLAIIVAVLALSYGIALEFVQKYWIPNRSFDGWDILADGIGSFLPLFFIRITKRLLKF